MKTKLTTLLAALSILLVAFPAPTSAQVQDPGTVLQDPDRYCEAPICAGYGEADATWHVGAGAGQYSNKNPDNVVNSVAGGEVDPHGHSIAQSDSYGVHSRLSYRAIVVEDAEGDQVAFVKADSYLAMDYLARRAGQILLTSGSRVQYEEIFHMASHNHSSPYYMTPSPGPWVFQDAFDIRAFEYHAKALAGAILAAEEAAVPARMGATTVTHDLFKGMIQRKGISDDGTPRGYPDDFGDLGLSVVRFDDISEGEANAKPIASLINFGQHPEGLDNHDLITGDFVAPLERFVERATGAPAVFGQGDVGSAEAGPGRPEKVGALDIPARWSHAGHAQGERGAYLLSRDVAKGFSEIETGSPLVPYSSDFDVEAGNAFVAGPYSHPYPAVSACRTETTLEGQPGVGNAADCTRGPHADEGLGPAKEGSDEVWEPVAEGTGHGQENPLPSETDKGLYEKLKEQGVPIPDNYDVPSYFALEENTRLHLQAFKMGEVVVASCACEAQVDLILNFETRANETQGDIWEGFDWTEPFTNPSTGETRPAPMLCTQDPDTGDHTCTRNPAYGRDRAVLGSFTATDYEFKRMKAQIHNDGAGWDAPENVAGALSESDDPTQIFGNFTHEELSPELGYKLAIGVGHAGDYNGYTVSYREFQSWDDYRKSLTSYGPHTADYMVTRMVRLAGTLNGATYPELEADIARGLPDEARQLAMSTALGATSAAAYEAWWDSVPVDKNTAEDPIGEIFSQPEDITRFDAATFSWRGGSNAMDNPVVKVQRLVDGEWVDFADQSGEVQTMLDFPNSDPAAGKNAFVDTYTSSHDWRWTANFEAFNANPAGIGSTPTGEYRFVVDGMYRNQPAFRAGYHVESDPFTVSRWDGVNVRDLSLNDDGSVTFGIDPIEYPHTYDSVFPYVDDGNYPQLSGKTAQGDDIWKGDELGKPFCTTCTFRPWAEKGEVETATVSVVRADGTEEQVQAQRTADGSWRADAALYEGDRAFVAAGGVVDNYGERNAAPTNEVVGTRTRPEPTPTETVEPTPTDSATPTEDPGPAVTELVFTDRSDESGQFSDEALIEAKLTTDSGATPIVGAEIVFEVLQTGETWTALTDPDGLATKQLDLSQQPNHYDIVARFAGSEDLVASANMTGFVVEREDSTLELTGRGKGKGKDKAGQQGTGQIHFLTARLSDSDTPASRLAGVVVRFFSAGVEIAQATTNAQGEATVEVEKRHFSDSYEARFGGDDFYEPSSDTVENNP